MPGIDSALFRQLMGRFTTGVVVLTARTADGTPQGMTVNSLASVSLEPPLLLVSIDHKAEMHRTLTTTGHFALNVLSASQEGLSRRFAGDRAGRFDGIGWQPSPLGLVWLDGALAHMECERVALHEAGDHTILVGLIQAGTAGDGRPLCYFRGGYASLA
jgi:flavin reductase (DIM6/NTAB) family NADH-FMN oxidoreductase RutF